jgi:hypothetical protein
VSSEERFLFATIVGIEFPCLILMAATAIRAGRRLPPSTHTLAALIGANRSFVISGQWRLMLCYIQTTLLGLLRGIHGLLVGAKFENKGAILAVNTIERFILLAAALVVISGPSAFGIRRSVPYGPHYIPRRTRLTFLWNPLFRPSHDSLVRQNQEIDRLDLPRIQDNDELERLEEPRVASCSGNSVTAVRSRA